MQVITHIIGAVQGKHPIGIARSGKWPAVRKHHLAAHAACAVCGSTDNLEVHHIRPFHLHPEVELDQSNLVTLCESKKGGVNCHLFFGHLGSFKSFNPSVTGDAAAWFDKIIKRPTEELNG